jgi:hypothetical protein
MAMAPPGIEAKNVGFRSTPETRLKINAPSAPIKKTAIVAARIAGKLPARAATTVGVNRRYRRTEDYLTQMTCIGWRMHPHAHQIECGNGDHRPDHPRDRRFY